MSKSENLIRWYEWPLFIVMAPVIIGIMAFIQLSHRRYECKLREKYGVQSKS